MIDFVDILQYNNTMFSKSDREPEEFRRMGDLFPPILNCAGGILRDNLRGQLTTDEVDEISALPIAPRTVDQVAEIKEQLCSRKEGRKVEIAYFPQEIPLSGKRIIVALCLDNGCCFRS